MWSQDACLVFSVSLFVHFQRVAQEGTADRRIEKFDPLPVMGRSNSLRYRSCRWSRYLFMPNANVYERPDSSPPGKKSWGEWAQIGLLSVIIVVFFAIAASNGVALLEGALRH